MTRLVDLPTLAALVRGMGPERFLCELADEIQAGRVLVVVDAPREQGPAIEAAMRRVGAVPLPFEQLSALS